MASTRSDIERSTRPLPSRPTGVDGMLVSSWEEPADAADAAAILRDAALAGQAVTPVGGGTKLALGNLPARVELALSTARLNRVLHYEPTDMTLSVEAGVRFGELQSLLAGRGQTLPIETPDDEEATIGGLIATALAGPRRLGCGTLRDLLIGIAVAYPDGTVAKAGGLVVKNVTGFDLMRLHLGALGTLGVIVSANFKVLPVARAEATLVSEPLPLADAIRVAAGARQGRLRPIAVEVFGNDEVWRTAVRFEGRSQTVALGVESVRGVTAWAESLADDESRDWWRAYVGRQSLRTGDVMIRCGVAPKAHAALANGLSAVLQTCGVRPLETAISPGLGAALVRMGADALSPDELAGLQAELLKSADTVTVLAATPEQKAGIDVWGKAPETVSVMRALKAEFDPTNTLNPGRFIDRI